MSNLTTHGMAVGLERIDEHVYLKIDAFGKLTHEDYQTITPLLESALDGVADHCVLALIDASKLEGWEARAAWDDFKIGIRQGKKFDKVAVFGGGRLVNVGTSIGNWFTSAKLKSFDEKEDAVRWLVKDL